MKTISKTLFTIVFVTIFMSNSYAQQYLPDSLHIRIDNKMEVMISSYGYKDLWTSIKPDLVSLQSIVSSNPEFEKYSSCSIEFVPEQSFSINQSSPEEIIRINGETQIKYSFSNKCKISSSKYFMQIRFNDFNDLIQESIIKQIEQAIDSCYAINARYAGIYDYSFNGEQLIENNVSRSKYGQMDALLLKGGVGVGLIKNQPITDISAVIALSFSKKGLSRHEFYLSDNLIYNFDSDQKLYTNNFLNLGYRINVSQNKKSPNWIGIEAGYLLNRNGDFFEKNTFRLGFNWELGKSIAVSPQLYFSGNSSKLYPGLRVGFGF